jgi:hypothetical protein
MVLEMVTRAFVAIKTKLDIIIFAAMNSKKKSQTKANGNAESSNMNQKTDQTSDSNPRIETVAVCSSISPCLTPHLNIFCHGKDGTQKFTTICCEDGKPYNFEKSENDMDPELIQAKLPLVFSNDGSKVCALRGSNNSVNIVHLNTSRNVVVEIPFSNTQYSCFSPLGNYLITWKPLSSTSNSNGSNCNLCIWDTSLPLLRYALSQKVLKKDMLQFTDDESYISRMVTNEIHIMSGSQLRDNDFTQPNSNSNLLVGKIHHKGISLFTMSPKRRDNDLFFATFNVESKGNPARVTMYKFSVKEGVYPVTVTIES